MKPLSLILLMFFFSPQTSWASNRIYDENTNYSNPLTGLSEDCQASVEFYRVSRKVFPLVWHIFIGTKIRTSCPNGTNEFVKIYGASKGDGDLDFFQKDISADAKNSTLLGLAINRKAISALDTASEISQNWQKQIEHSLYFYPRMVFTPVFGRICAVSAQEVIGGIRPYLEPIR